MNPYKKILDFYINSSIHVALAVVSLSVITSICLDIPIDWSLLSFTFFGTITAYNFVKYAGVAKLHHRSLTKGLKTIQIFSFFVFLCFLSTIPFVNPGILIWSAAFGLLTLLYALPFFGNKRNLRSVSGIKIFIIAIVWAGVTVILPAVHEAHLNNVTAWVIFSQRFFFVLVLILPFEIRDLKYDLVQLGTIPQRLGVKKTKLLGLIFLGLVVLLEFLKDSTSFDSIGSLIFIAVVCATLVWRTKQQQSFYYSSLWVEAVPILWLVTLIIFRSF